jgi:hypothetical protein
MPTAICVIYPCSSYYCIRASRMHKAVLNVFAPIVKSICFTERDTSLSFISPGNVLLLIVYFWTSYRGLGTRNASSYHKNEHFIHLDNLILHHTVYSARSPFALSIRPYFPHFFRPAALFRSDLQFKVIQLTFGLDNLKRLK